jgi:predicted small integral membrane protein
MIDLSWMAWTWPTAAFFLAILGLLLGMALWERLSPGGGPRVGALGFETTRGDRLFLSLLSAAFIHLGWLGLTDLPLWWALGLAVLWAALIFRLV